MLLHSCIKCYRNKARWTQSCGVPCFNIFLQMFSLLLTCFKYNNMTERKEKQVYAKHFLCTRTLQTQHDSVFLDGRCLFSLGLGCDTSISVSHEISSTCVSEDEELRSWNSIILFVDLSFRCSLMGTSTVGPHEWSEYSRSLLWLMNTGLKFSSLFLAESVGRKLLGITRST